MHIIDYRTAAEYLGRKTDRPLPGRASRIIRRTDSSIAIRYQQTDVVTYHADGPIVLQSGGWQSVMTKARFSEYTRAIVFSQKGTWFVRMGSWEVPPALYVDGMAIDADGLPVDPQYPAASDVQRKRLLDKQVTAYIAGYAKHIEEHGLDDPGNGDCFGCLMQAKDEPTTTPHGRVEPFGLDHYLSHFEEQYYVPSLLANAILARGYGNPGVIWHMIKTRKDGKYAADILRSYFRKLKPELLKAAS
jgi:hypothetical protein